MGKVRIVKQYCVYRVEEEVTKSQYNEQYKTWETIKLDGHKEAKFNTQEEAEIFAEDYVKRRENEKLKIIKEYSY